jgi:hypothetical protein
LEVQLIQEFMLEEVDLAEVGLGGIFADEVQVLDERAAVGVALDTLSGDEGDAGLRVFGEAVGCRELDGGNVGWHLLRREG